MAEPLPAPVFYSRVAGDPDDAWEIVTNPVWMEPGVETEFVCVGPSAVTKKVWDSTAEQELVRIREVYDTAGGAFFVSDGAYQFEESNSTVPANDAGDVIGAWVDAVNDLVAIQATTANKPKLRFTPETGLRWADSNTATCALNVTFASALGSACTVARVGPDGVEFLENQTIGTSYNIAPTYGWNGDVAIIDRPLTATEKALFTRFMLRHKPGLGAELWVDPEDLTTYVGTPGTWDGEYYSLERSADSTVIQKIRKPITENIAYRLYGEYSTLPGYTLTATLLVNNVGRPIITVTPGNATNVFMKTVGPSELIIYQGTANRGCKLTNASLKEIL